MRTDASDRKLKSNRYLHKGVRFCSCCFVLIALVIVYEFWAVIYYGMLYQEVKWILNPPPRHIKPYMIHDTREYQLTLDLNAWIKRNETVSEWIEQMNQYHPDLHLSLDTADLRIFTQGYLHTEGRKNCYGESKVKVRLRHIATGKYAGTSTSDVKRNGFGDPDVCLLPFWPAEKYLPNATQICEMDIHPCFHKFARTTRVKHPGYINFETCKEVTEVYPYAYPDLKSAKKPEKQKPSPPKHITTVWEMRFEGQVDSMAYTVSFVLRYNDSVTLPWFLENLNNPNVDIVPEEGEWSVKVAPLPDTTAGHMWTLLPWNQQGLKRMNDLYFRMVLKFDKDTQPEHKECANRYFETGEKSFP